MKLQRAPLGDKCRVSEAGCLAGRADDHHRAARTEAWRTEGGLAQPITANPAEVNAALGVLDRQLRQLDEQVAACPPAARQPGSFGSGFSRGRRELARNFTLVVGTPSSAPSKCAGKKPIECRPGRRAALGALTFRQNTNSTVTHEIFYRILLL